MKVSMKAAVAAACSFAAASVVACSGFYAGRLTTADGTTLIGRTADYHPYSAASRIIKVEAGAASNRYAHVQTPKVTALKRGPYAGGSVNEMGLMLTGTVTAGTCTSATNADPFVSAKAGGVGEADLPGLVIGNCATAREGVIRLGEEIAKHGHRAPDIYLLADRTESWYMEVYTGHQWAAVKMPEDKVAVFGNQFMIGAFATNRTDVLYSPGLISTAVKGKFIKWVDEKKGIVNLFDTYSDGLQTHSTYRAWYGRHLLAPGTEGVYATNRVMELFYTPKKKVVLSDFFNLMRSRYEGSAACPEERPGAPYRVFGVAMQGNCHVLQMRHDLPPATCATAWVCVGPSSHGVFMPVNAATRTVWPAYSRDQMEGPFRADPERAGDTFLALATLAEAQTHTFTNGASGPVWVDLRPRYGNGVRDFWATCEQRFAREWPAVVSRGDVAEITAYTTNVQARAFADAKRLYDDLLWYAAANNHSAAEGGKKGELYDPPFKPQEK